MPPNNNISSVRAHQRVAIVGSQGPCNARLAYDLLEKYWQYVGSSIATQERRLERWGGRNMWLYCTLQCTRLSKRSSRRASALVTPSICLLHARTPIYLGAGARVDWSVKTWFNWWWKQLTSATQRIALSLSLSLSLLISLFFLSIFVFFLYLSLALIHTHSTILRQGQLKISIKTQTRFAIISILRQDSN